MENSEENHPRRQPRRRGPHAVREREDAPMADTELEELLAWYNANQDKLPVPRSYKVEVETCRSPG